MSREKESLSIVIPAYNEAENIEAAAKAIFAVTDREGIHAAIYFIDDGSKDATWEKICALSDGSDRVRGVRFSRNFGKEAAIFAGLEAAAGDCCAVLDCDLQHPPETLAQMYRLWQNGAEVVEGVKKSRGREGAVHKAMTKLFYGMMSAATKSDMSRASDFKLLDRRAVDSILALPERNTFFRALSAWVGYRTAIVEFDVQPRAGGSSKWNRLSLVRYAVNNITSFTTKPLQIVTALGVLFLLGALVLGVDTLINYLSGRSLGGFTTVILIQLIIGSIIMISLGIIGVYIGKIYEEVKARPRYVIAETKALPDRRN